MSRQQQPTDEARQANARPNGHRTEVRQRIERYLEQLVSGGVTTEEQSREALVRAWKYYHRLRREDRRVMLALMLRFTLRHYHQAERRRQRRQP